VHTHKIKFAIEGSHQIESTSSLYIQLWHH